MTGFLGKAGSYFPKKFFNCKLKIQIILEFKNSFRKSCPVSLALCFFGQAVLQKIKGLVTYLLYELEFYIFF